MTDSELAQQLSDLDWGAQSDGKVAVGGMRLVSKTGDLVDPTVVGSADVSAIDVEIPGAQPRARVVSGPVVRRSHHKKKAESVPTVVSAHVVGTHVRERRPRDQPMDILVRRGESPAVMALFESMWREVGHNMALEVGRPKASKQDAALGWYMMLEAMRARDSRA